jgi:DNA-binding beta-propeller fold protein YncE
MKVTNSGLAALTLLVFADLPPALAETKWNVVKTFQIGGQGSWDYITVDSASHRLYVPRTTHTMVIEAESGRILADIPGQKNAHGVAIVPESGRGFISDGGGDGAIVIFDLKTNAVLGTLAAMPDADGIIYDPHSGQILTVSGRGKALMSFKPDIDPQNGKIDQPIALRGEPEFLAADAAGKVYINLMDTHQVAVVDFRTRKVIANWPVAPGGLPVGMAIDPKNGRLFIGCRGPRKLIVMSTKDGKVISDLPIGESVDAVKFDGDYAFASTSGAELSIARETSPGKFTIVQTVKTGEGARTMGLDASTRKIYLPAAEFESGANGRRTPKPGSFMILVVAPQTAK